MPWVVQWYRDGCDCLMKDVKICMMIHRATDRLWWMKIWCVHLKRILERTNDLPLHHIPCIFPKFHGHFFTKLCLINSGFRNCVHAEYWRCLWKNSSWNGRPVHWPFWHDTVRKVITFLSHVVTGDETWLSHATPELKQQSMEWRHTSLSTKTKFKQTTLTRKIMCTVFWDRKGVLLVNFLLQGSTINTDVYCNTLKKLHCTIHNKWRGMLSWGVVMIHDNTRPHTATATQNLIMTFGWK